MCFQHVVSVLLPAHYFTFMLHLHAIEEVKAGHTGSWKESALADTSSPPRADTARAR